MKQVIMAAQAETRKQASVDDDEEAGPNRITASAHYKQDL